MSFALFIVITAVLFLRPTELLPAVRDWPIYEVGILCCLASSLDRVFGQLSLRRLRENPITVCILGILVAVVLSALIHHGTDDAASAGFELFKVVLYHVTLLAVVDSPERLRRFLVCWLWMIMGVALLPLFQERGLLNLDLIPSIKEFTYDPFYGVRETLRLKSVGLDPNDLAMLLAPPMILCMWKLADREAGGSRFFWLAPLALFFHVFLRTQSRGGLVCLIAGVAATAAASLGIKRTMIGMAAAVPALMVFAGARISDVSALESGTGQTRVRLWSSALAMFREDPIFGVGHGGFLERMGEVAHNSYLDCFAELGFVGGACFTGAFLCAIWMLWRATPKSVVVLRTQAEVVDQQMLMHLRPFLIGVAVAYAAGMLSLSRANVVPTYMILGLATSWIRLASPSVASAPPQFDMRFARGLATVGVATLCVTHVFVRFCLRW